MDKIDEMKEMWQELTARVGVLEEENKRLSRIVRNSSYKSTQEKLINKYLKFIFVECVMIIWMSIFLIFNPQVVEKYRLITIIYWGIFFLFEIILDTYLMMRVKAINVYNSNVSEMAIQAAKTWKIHKIGIIIGMPLAIGAVILFGFALDANQFTIAGMIVGGVVGLIIGIRQLMKFLQYYRILQSEEE